jgi:ABC-type oligopeptide transport system ATPase subunit
MKLHRISTDKAFRSYKSVRGHTQAKALFVLQQQILETVDRVLVSRNFIRKYPDEASGHTSLNTNLTALHALMSAKRAIRGL